ncbi:aldehyde dehydrogenase family protein [Bradyrhizobium manausense]|uniref:aldehyde dehydrogenase family protein n=1 Tax=Bradyrhizobium manausense TaxID=989370 RepID=UPI000AE682D9
MYLSTSHGHLPCGKSRGHGYSLALDCAGNSYRNRARGLKKTVLELGGSDPYRVLEDADLDLAAAVCARGRLINAGQSCIAAKRFIIVDKVDDRFVELFVRRMADPKMGDPLKQDTEVGPLSRHDLRDTLHRYAEAASRRARVAYSAARARGGPAPIILQPSLPR